MRAQRRTVEPPYRAFSAGLSPGLRENSQTLLRTSKKNRSPGSASVEPNVRVLCTTTLSRARADRRRRGSAGWCTRSRRSRGSSRPPAARAPAPGSRRRRSRRTTPDRTGRQPTAAAARRSAARGPGLARAGVFIGWSRPSVQTTRLASTAGGWPGRGVRRPGAAQPLGRRRRGDGVVVEQPDQVGRVGQRPLDAGREAAGAAGVRASGARPRGRRSARAAARSCRRCWRCRPPPPPPAAWVCAASAARDSSQQVPPVPGHHDRDDPALTDARSDRTGARSAASSTGRSTRSPRSRRAGCRSSRRPWTGVPWSSPSWPWPGLVAGLASFVALPLPSDLSIASVTIDWIFGDVGVTGADRRGHERDRAHRLGAGLHRELGEVCRARRRAGRW